MQIVDKNINDLIFAEYNPRQLMKDEYKQLKDSITRFGLVDPIIVNKNEERKNIIVGGHQRVRIAKDMKIKEVPCVEVDLTLDKERELNIRLNKNNGSWDYDALADMFDVDQLTDWGFTEGELVGFDLEEDVYTKKIKSPVYNTKNKKPLIQEMVDDRKTNKLIEEIEKSSLGKEEKEFLKNTATRHYIFNYSKIADYYAHSNKEMKGLMERSALVIIDYNKAIENGFTELSEYLTTLQEDDE